jgi:hypothetical protein
MGKSPVGATRQGATMAEKNKEAAKGKNPSILG